MDLYPLFNSIRISLISTILVFFIGIFFAYYAFKLPRILRCIADAILTLPLVMPPTVIGFFLLLVFGLNSPFGNFLSLCGIRFVMTWYGGVIASFVVSFPFMYRTALGAFESYDTTLTYAAKTLGLSNSYIFWRIMLPNCKAGLISGIILSFARGVGEYGATSMLIGYTPGRTATISTTVYQLWRTNNEKQAFIWVFVNLLLSAVLITSVNIVEYRAKERNKRKHYNKDLI